MYFGDGHSRTIYDEQNIRSKILSYYQYNKSVLRTGLKGGKESTCRGKRLSVLTYLALSALLPSVAVASVVGGDIPYQTYRDFAENKGQF